VTDPKVSGTSEEERTGKGSDVVELVFPVHSDLVVLARLSVATLASRAGFDVEEIEDLRLAVDELCILAIAGATRGRVGLTFRTDDHQIEVACALLGAAGDGTAPDSGTGSENLSTRILDALVDEHGRDVGGGGHRTWLRKRRSR
jgi:serine/threonine-protein kinase RsbW